MINRELSRQIQRLDDLIKRTTEASAGTLELQSHWAKYICVLSAGLLENAITELYGEYTRRKSHGNIHSYVSSLLEGIQSANCQKFIDVTSRFNKMWGEELLKFVSVDGRKEALDTIIANRNRIAHGEDSGITIVRIKEYLEKSIEVLEFVENQCK